DLLHHLDALTGDATGDGQLLKRFASTRDPGAFAALVRRHGPLVMGVCRRVLGRGPDLDDAFQATFLVLAKKAGSIRRHDSVGGWLHAVARRLAVHLKTQQSLRRHQSLDSVAEHPTMSVDPA